MHEKHTDRKAPDAEFGTTIAEARSELFRKELDSLYDNFPGAKPKRYAS
jgi:hypothetical protein